MRYTSASLLMAVLILGTHCSREIKSKTELLAFVRDKSNGLYKESKERDILLEVMYRPHDLIVAQKIEGINYTASQIDSLKNALLKYDYFTLNISRNGQEVTNAMAQDPERFTKAIDYLSFGIGRDIILTFEADTIHIEDFIHSRSFGAANSNAVLLAFKSNLNGQSENFALVYDDSFFGTGLHRFDFDIDNLKALPSLKLTP